jgi:hypothetical protein
MKAIFLDIDGIIATPTSVRLNYLLGRTVDCQWYDAVALTYLGRLVSETGALVVLTSTWREDLGHDNPMVEAIMHNLFMQLENAGAPVTSMTPVLRNTDRSGEIAAWLDAHPCEGYVIFDDLAHFDDRPEVIKGHLVLVADSEGIRSKHYYLAREILQGPSPKAPEG